MRPIAIPIVVAALLASAPARADPMPDMALSRSGDWEINYDQDSCHLVAPFGEGDGRILVNFTRYEPSSWFDITLYGKPLSRRDQYFHFMVDFGPVSEPRHTEALIGDAGGLPVLLLGLQRFDGWRTWDRDYWKTPNKAPVVTPEQEAQVTRLAVTSPVNRDRGLKFDLGPMAAPMRALRTCTANLVGKWGYNPRAMASLKSPPVPTEDPHGWLSYLDFPGKKVAAAANGVVQIRLDVEADGSVGGCHVLQTTLDPDFAELSCRLIGKRARFKPAIDKDGNAVKAYYVQGIKWLGGVKFGG